MGILNHFGGRFNMLTVITEHDTLRMTATREGKVSVNFDLTM